MRVKRITRNHIHGIWIIIGFPRQPRRCCQDKQDDGPSSTCGERAHASNIPTPTCHKVSSYLTYLIQRSSSRNINVTQCQQTKNSEGMPVYKYCDTGDSCMSLYDRMLARYAIPPLDGVVMQMAEASIQDVIDHMTQNRWVQLEYIIHLVDLNKCLFNISDTKFGSFTTWISYSIQGSRNSWGGGRPGSPKRQVCRNFQTEKQKENTSKGNPLPPPLKYILYLYWSCMISVSILRSKFNNNAVLLAIYTMSCVYGKVKYISIEYFESLGKGLKVIDLQFHSI